MILPTDQEIKNALWEHAHSDLDGDTIRYLFAASLDKADHPLSEDEADALFDAVAGRFNEVMR